MEAARVLEERGLYPATAPRAVERTRMTHVWSDLSFVHWRAEPADVQRLLPPGVTVDTLDGSAWVGLIPFHLLIGTGGGKSLPWVSRFAEMNVRTYVRGPDGTPAIWFVSLDAERLGAVAIARATYGLNYNWAKMRFARAGGIATYETRRRWPGPRGASSSLAIEVGDPCAADETVEFLTNRWRFYCTRRGRLMHAEVVHEPWPLHEARVLHVDDGLIAASGLQRPKGEPLVHFSPRVDVLMGPPVSSLGCAEPYSS